MPGEAEISHVCQSLALTTLFHMCCVVFIIVLFFHAAKTIYTFKSVQFHETVYTYIGTLFYFIHCFCEWVTG